MKNSEDRINELRNLIEKYDYEYYINHNSIINDFEYDQLYKELTRLEQENPDLFTSGSPTQNVPSDNLNTFIKVKHKQRMLSLPNTYTFQEIIDFDRRNREQLGVDSIEYFVELKLDGVSLSCVYENGKLEYAVTRGDGEVGDEVTMNALQIQNIPNMLNKIDGYNLNDIEVRGEVLIFKHTFAEINNRQIANNQKTYANPRNLASGTLKLLDPKEVSQRGLYFASYYLFSDNKQLSLLSQNTELLKQLGFDIINSNLTTSNLNDLKEFIEEWDQKRDELPFYIDGLVIKVNSINYQKELGTVSRFPKWAIAYKYSAEQVETKLLDITYQVGRTGVVSPVAELEPVHLAQTMVKRATLHNEDYIKEIDLRVGDYVYVEKGGEIIPKVVGVNFEKRDINSKIFEFPKKCPCHLQTNLVKFEDEAGYYCIDPNCPWQIRKKIEHFASRNAMNIEFLGEKTIDELVSLGFMNKLSDIYFLGKYREEIRKLDGWGEKSINNLLDAIEKSKEKPFENVLFGLGIRYVGEFVADIIAKEIRNIDKLIQMTEEELISINQIGIKIAKSIKIFLSQSENIELLVTLRQVGLKFESEGISKVVENRFDNQTFLFTGELEKYTRNQAEQIVVSLGGRIVSSVSKKLNYLVVGANPGSKLKKAQDLKCTIISENEFLELIK
jgi:DNA ligase (NAD+)